MIVTEHFVFVHVPKTGGLFVRDLAERHFKVIWTSPRDRFHDAYANLPSQYRDLPALSFVRNPWDYYVSSWAYMIKIGAERSPMAKAAKRGFDDFVRTGVAQRGGYPDTFATMSRGTEVRRFEGLPQELLSFFEQHEIPTTPQLERDILTSPAANPTEHGPYQRYYDDETRELVAIKCREIIESYGYCF